jgi:hypothetical protein
MNKKPMVIDEEILKHTKQITELKKRVDRLEHSIAGLVLYIFSDSVNPEKMEEFIKIIDNKFNQEP